ncbi:hypothetical protein MXD62_05880 [Frankia sp. Mgl5]|uniref:hypothetical protein n=1 Tax=Frankia sp. Mgl5 TaxID=2933793 RepID=UPI00200C65A4|nr:hypothetical protein [Frankia sp. Mgl5]MCK9926700.1 hypothetical protein [Frankia sp. Mgl5]
MRGISRIKTFALIAGIGAPLAVIPLAAAPASAAMTGPLAVAGTVQCRIGSAESLLISGGGESHGASVGVGGRFSVVFANPSVPSTATVQVRCDVAGQRTYHPTSFLLRHPAVGQVLNVNLVA